MARARKKISTVFKELEKGYWLICIGSLLSSVLLGDVPGIRGLWHCLSAFGAVSPKRNLCFPNEQAGQRFCRSTWLR
jgi:hypothetical protein